MHFVAVYTLKVLIKKEKIGSKKNIIFILYKYLSVKMYTK